MTEKNLENVPSLLDISIYALYEIVWGRPSHFPPPVQEANEPRSLGTDRKKLNTGQALLPPVQLVEQFPRQALAHPRSVLPEDEPSTVGRKRDELDPRSQEELGAHGRAERIQFALVTEAAAVSALEKETIPVTEGNVIDRDGLFSSRRFLNSSLSLGRTSTPHGLVLLSTTTKPDPSAKTRLSLDQLALRVSLISSVRRSKTAPRKLHGTVVDRGRPGSGVPLPAAGGGLW